MPSDRDTIIKRVQSIDSIPTLPTVMMKLSEALQDINCSARDIERILSNDPAIATRLLRTVNSPMFATGGEKVESLQVAITRLGFREVKNIALSTGVLKMFEKVQSRIFDRTEFWKHCLGTSLAAIEIGVWADQPRLYQRDELHLAGLVHDIGIIILDAYFSDLLEESLAVSIQRRMPLFLAERLVMGIDHAELGGFVAERWNLPNNAVAAIRYHHEPDKAPEKTQVVVNAVHLANYVVNTLELGAGGDFTTPVFEHQVLKKIGIGAGELQELAKRVGEASAEFSDMF